LFYILPNKAEYEVYIAKIKAGTLKNSGDQSDDNKNTQETQADLLYFDLTFLF